MKRLSPTGFEPLAHAALHKNTNDHHSETNSANTKLYEILKSLKQISSAATRYTSIVRKFLEIIVIPHTLLECDFLEKAKVASDVWTIKIAFLD